MSALLTTLLTAGPSLIRMIGETRGGTNAVNVAHTLADAVEAFTGKSNSAESAKLQALADSLPPDEVFSLKVALDEIAAERENQKLKHDLGMHQAQQTTIQNGDNSQDSYVSHTRPKVARQSFWATAAYTIVFELLGAFDKGPGANLELGFLLASPMLAYYGFRTWDKFSKQGASK